MVDERPGFLAKKIRRIFLAFCLGNNMYKGFRKVQILHQSMTISQKWLKLGVTGTHAGLSDGHCQ